MRQRIHLRSRDYTPTRLRIYVKWYTYDGVKHNFFCATAAILPFKVRPSLWKMAIPSSVHMTQLQHAETDTPSSSFCAYNVQIDTMSILDLTVRNGLCLETREQKVQIQSDFRDMCLTELVCPSMQC